MRFSRAFACWSHRVRDASSANAGPKAEEAFSVSMDRESQAFVAVSALQAGPVQSRRTARALYRLYTRLPSSHERLLTVFHRSSAAKPKTLSRPFASPSKPTLIIRSNYSFKLAVQQQRWPSSVRVASPRHLRASVGMEEHDPTALFSTKGYSSIVLCRTSR